MGITPGSRLGSYEVIGLLGEGGMGQVYRARDARLDREVATKVLPDAVAGDPERLARFEREAKTLAALNHPHIAHVYELADRALVMELVPGEDLSARISRGAMPLAEALPLARQIVEALAAAHEKGIVHRDLKPANVKITPDGNVKVLDFGLAKAVQGDGSGSRQQDSSPSDNSPTLTAPATQIGMILGTAAYMAPEQARGRPVDARGHLGVWRRAVRNALRPPCVQRRRRERRPRVGVEERSGLGVAAARPAAGHASFAPSLPRKGRASAAQRDCRREVRPRRGGRAG